MPYMPYIPITLHPKTKKEWFILWLVIVIIIVIIYLFIMMIDEKLLHRYDFIQYITNKKDHHTESQIKANIYALNHDAMRLTDLTSEQLLYLPPEYIPGIIDIEEDDVFRKISDN
jgi:hypothetical protein